MEMAEMGEGKRFWRIYRRLEALAKEELE